MNFSREYITNSLNTHVNWESALFRHCYLNDKTGKLASWDDEYEESDGYDGVDEYGEGVDFDYEDDSLPDYEDGFFADTDIADVEYMEEQDDDFSLSRDY